MDRMEFGDIVLANTEMLYRISKSILKNDTDCEDAAQEAIAVAFSKLHRLRNDDFAKTWLVRILINECYRFLNRQKRSEALGEREVADSHVHDGYTDLYTALSSLDIKHRIPLVLYYAEGFSTQEIARLLGISQGTVKSRMARGRDKLRPMLEIREGIGYGKI